MEQQVPVPEKKMGKLRASYLLAVESFELFRKDKEILWFVVWNMLSVLVLAAIFIAGITGLVVTDTVRIPEEGEPTSATLEIVGYATLFLFYIAISFLTTFFGVGLTSVVAARIEGQNKSFSDGMKVAGDRMGAIFWWSVVSSTVGLVLQIIADKSAAIGKLFSWLGGVAWGIATFFIIPVLALENQSVGESIKRSGKVFVDRWGETLIMHFSLGFFFAGVHLTLLILFFSLGALLFSSVPALLLLLVAYLTLFVAAAIMQAVLEAVFKVVLYFYATRGTVPDSFTPELIIGALTKKVVPTV